MIPNEFICQKKYDPDTKCIKTVSQRQTFRMFLQLAETLRAQASLPPANRDAHERHHTRAKSMILVLAHPETIDP